MVKRGGRSGYANSDDHPRECHYFYGLRMRMSNEFPAERAPRDHTGDEASCQRQKSANARIATRRDSPLGTAAGGNCKTFTTRIMTEHSRPRFPTDVKRGRKLGEREREFRVHRGPNGDGRQRAQIALATRERKASVVIFAPRRRSLKEFSTTKT